MEGTILLVWLFVCTWPASWLITTFWVLSAFQLRPPIYIQLLTTSKTHLHVCLYSTFCKECHSKATLENVYPSFKTQLQHQLTCETSPNSCKKSCGVTSLDSLSIYSNAPSLPLDYNFVCIYLFLLLNCIPQGQGLGFPYAWIASSQGRAWYTGDTQMLVQ